MIEIIKNSLPIIGLIGIIIGMFAGLKGWKFVKYL